MIYHNNPTQWPADDTWDSINPDLSSPIDYDESIGDNLPIMTPDMWARFASEEGDLDLDFPLADLD